MEYQDRHHLERILKKINALKFTDNQLAVLICSTRIEGGCCGGCSGDCFGHDVEKEIKNKIKETPKKLIKKAFKILSSKGSYSDNWDLIETNVEKIKKIANSLIPKNI